MRTRIKEVQGIDWLDGALMNCIWEGPRLRDILLRAGVKYDKAEKSSDPKEYHVQFASHSQKTPEEDWYGGSIPLDRALAEDKDVILAVKVRVACSPSMPCRSLS
jgi:sulfite oxidase